jgi:hypothetical protein
MTINVYNVEFVIGERSLNTRSDLELLAHARSVQQLKTNGVFRADALANFPVASSHAGEMWLDETTSLLYFSNGTSWVAFVTP